MKNDSVIPASVSLIELKLSVAIAKKFFISFHRTSTARDTLKVATAYQHQRLRAQFIS